MKILNSNNTYTIIYKKKQLKLQNINKTTFINSIKP